MRLRETAPWLAVLTVLAAGYLVWRFLWSLLFVHNDQYRIRSLEIVPGALTTSEEIASISAIREGDNLFAKGADEIRRSLLVLDRVDRVEASFRLPDALRIAVIDRVPVARIRGKGQSNLYADANGAVFVISREKASGLGPLPVIENGGNPIPLSPLSDGENAGQCLADCAGTPVGAEARAARAVQFVRLFDGPFTDEFTTRPGAPGRRPFEIESLDVENGLWLVVVAVRGSEMFTVRFLWEELSGEKEILERLRKFADVLAERSSANKRGFDVIRTENGEIQVHADQHTH